MKETRVQSRGSGTVIAAVLAASERRQAFRYRRPNFTTAVPLQYVLKPVYSDTTQLNSTSTRSQREQLSPISSERRDPVDSVCKS